LYQIDIRQLNTLETHVEFAQVNTDPTGGLLKTLPVLHVFGCILCESLWLRVVYGS